MLQSLFRAFVIVLLLVSVSGCVCFQPTVKQLPDPRPGKEGQMIEVHEEMSWPWKAFWGTMSVLSWFLPGKSSEKEQVEREKREASWNNQYQEAIRRR